MSNWKLRFRIGIILEGLRFTIARGSPTREFVSIENSLSFAISHRFCFPVADSQNIHRHIIRSSVGYKHHGFFSKLFRIYPGPYYSRRTPRAIVEFMNDFTPSLQSSSSSELLEDQVIERPKLVPSSTIQQLGSNNARAEQNMRVSDSRASSTDHDNIIDKKVSSQSLLTPHPPLSSSSSSSSPRLYHCAKLKVFHKCYPDGTPAVIRRGRFKGEIDERHTHCAFAGSHGKSGNQLQMRKCYCMTQLIIPSPLRQAMNASDFGGESSSESPIDEQISNWNLKDIHFLSRVRHLLIEGRTTCPPGEQRYYQHRHQCRHQPSPGFNHYHSGSDSFPQSLSRCGGTNSLNSCKAKDVFSSTQEDEANQSALPQSQRDSFCTNETGSCKTDVVIKFETCQVVTAT